jgi:hypothetical protein
VFGRELFWVWVPSILFVGIVWWWRRGTLNISRTTVDERL